MYVVKVSSDDVKLVLIHDVQPCPLVKDNGIGSFSIRKESGRAGALSMIPMASGRATPKGLDYPTDVFAQANQFGGSAESFPSNTLPWVEKLWKSIEERALLESLTLTEQLGRGVR